MSLFKLKNKNAVEIASNKNTLGKVQEKQEIAKIEPRKYPHKKDFEIKNDLMDKHLSWLNKDYGNLSFFIADKESREIYKRDAESLNHYVKFRKFTNLISNIGFTLIVSVGVFAKINGDYAITWTSLAVLALIFSSLKLAVWTTVVFSVDNVIRMSKELKNVKAFEKFGDDKFKQDNTNFQELVNKHDELGLPDIRNQDEAVKYYNFFNLQGIGVYAECMSALWGCFTTMLGILCLCILFSESAQSLIDYLAAWWFLVGMLPALSMGGYLYLRVILEPKLDKNIIEDNSKKILSYSN